MDHTVTDQARKPSKSQFFDASKWIDRLNIKRAMRTLITAMLFLVDGETLATSKYPVTIDKIVDKSGYSRAQTFEILNDLEKAGIVERIRHRRQLLSGEWINDPTTYRIIIDDAERAILASAKASEPPRQRHPKRERRQRPAPMLETAHGPAEVAPLPLKEPSPPAPPVARPANVASVKANVVPPLIDEMKLPPQQPTGDAEIDALADTIATHARAAIRSAERATEKSAVRAMKAIDIAKYSIAAHALEVCGLYYIIEDDIIDCVYEWSSKVVETNKTVSPLHFAEKLKSFFRGKGDGISFVRRDMLMV